MSEITIYQGRVFTLSANSEEKWMNSTAIKLSSKIKPFIISRNTMPTLTHIEKNGRHFNLGQLKDFRKVESLDAFIPKTGRSSFSWVSLNTNEELKVHEHPIESMIIITRGQAELTGDISAVVNEGDIICVPRFTKHGFIGRGKLGFWGLSIQFEARGLYEDPQNALVTFDKQEEFKNQIRVSQAHWKRRCSAHPLFNFVKNLSDRTVFLRVFRHWSDAFQDLVLLRQVLVSDTKFYAITAAHLAEEFGHNAAFSHLKPFPPSVKIQAIYSWFNQKMLKLNDKHRVIFMHLALEGSASVFYNKLHDLFFQTNEAPHFEEHTELDHIHEGMEFDLIDIHTQDDCQSLLTTLNETWEMILELYSEIIEECQRLFSQPLSH